MSATTQQGLRQASARAATGFALDYNGDFHALFDESGIPNGAFDGRFLAWINQNLGQSYGELNGAMYALAAANGACNFSSLGTFSTDSGSSPALLMEDGSYILLEGGGKILLEH